MLKSARNGLVLTTAALAVTLAGCAGSQGRSAAASHFGGKSDGEVGLAMRALAALNANDPAAAVGFAERAVARTPDDAGFRALLGNAYFAGGRFASAEAAYKDSLTIYSNQPQVVLKLVLAQIAQGKRREAADFLAAARLVLDPADYGLALALAGQPGDAAAALLEAARQPGADARVRQNLALAHALSGDWVQARVVAAQDLGAGDVDARIKQWMLLANPVRAADQVAALTGIKPAASDPGQPVRLALRKDGTQTAFVAPQPEQAVTVALPEAVPAPPPAPVVEAEVAQSVPPAPPPYYPERVAAAEPAEAAAYIAPPPPPPPPAAKPAFTPAASPRKPARLVRAAAPQRRAGKSSAVVQLGAYGSASSVLAAWNTASRRHASLRAYAPMSARFNSGRGLVYRLSVRGFASQSEAANLCSQLKRAGGKCFVRSVAGDAPVQFASR